MSVVVAVAVVLAGYALGTFPTAVLVGRRQGFDPTAAGSGNPGASNVTRIGGARAGAVVLLGDAGKGALAAGLGYVIDGRTLAWFAGAAAVAGHLWPATRGFRGGKGVATAAGAGVVCAPLAAAAMAVLFAALVKVSGRAAVGSISIAALFPVSVALLGQSGVEVAVASGVAAVIILRHRGNIQRLLTGSEARVSDRRS